MSLPAAFFGLSIRQQAGKHSHQNSEIKGRRYLNEKEQILAKGKKEKAEFIDTLNSCQ